MRLLLSSILLATNLFAVPSFSAETLPVDEGEDLGIDVNSFGTTVQNGSTLDQYQRYGFKLVDGVDDSVLNAIDIVSTEMSLSPVYVKCYKRIDKETMCDVDYTNTVNGSGNIAGSLPAGASATIGVGGGSTERIILKVPCSIMERTILVLRQEQNTEGNTGSSDSDSGSND